MSCDRNSSQILDFYAAFDQRQLDQALAMLAPDFVAHLAGMPEPLDTEAFKAFGLEFYTAFTNSQHTFDQVIATDDQVVTCGTFTACHQGSFQGLPPTGQTVTIDVMHIDRLRQGQIIAHWGYGDALSLMQQLGMIVLPGPKLVASVARSLTSKWLPSSGKSS